MPNLMTLNFFQFSRLQSFKLIIASGDSPKQKNHWYLCCNDNVMDKLILLIFLDGGINNLFCDSHHCQHGIILRIDFIRPYVQLTDIFPQLLD